MFEWHNEFMGRRLLPHNPASSYIQDLQDDDTRIIMRRQLQWRIPNMDIRRDPSDLTELGFQDRHGYGWTSAIHSSFP